MDAVLCPGIETSQRPQLVMDALNGMGTDCIWLTPAFPLESAFHNTETQKLGATKQFITVVAS